MKRFSLSYKEKLKSKKDFEIIYSSGNILFSSDNNMKAAYIVERESDSPGVKIAAAVFKKSGIAVWRNRVKRLIREAFRLNKEILTSFCIKKNILLKIVFSPNLINQKKNKRVGLNDIMPGVVDIMLKFKSII